MSLPWGSSLILENSNLSWNLARKASFASQVFLGSDGIERFEPIPPQTGIVSGPVFLVGTTCSHERNWFWGGDFNVYASFFPDSQSNFMGTGLIFRQSLKLNNLNLLVAPKIEGISQYFWELKIPKYFKDVSIEVYWHDGEFLNSIEQKLQ